MKGLALALSWLTVLPVRAGAPDARTAAAALRWAPLVGGLVGAATGAVAVGLVALGVPAAVAGLLAVGFAGLATRGMHLDGLADTADGLGCYGPPERALAVMRDGGAGPFAVVTLLVVVGAQAAALATLATPVVTSATPAAVTASVAAGAPLLTTGDGVPADVGRVGGAVLGVAGANAAAPDAARPAKVHPRTAPGGPMREGSSDGPAAVLGVVAATALAGAAGRAAFLWVARRGMPAARPGGLGAAVVAALSWHTARRFGGMTGDVLGAASELATLTALVVLASR